MPVAANELDERFVLMGGRCNCRNPRLWGVYLRVIVDIDAFDAWFTIGYMMPRSGGVDPVRARSFATCMYQVEVH